MAEAIRMITSVGRSSSRMDQEIIVKKSCRQAHPIALFVPSLNGGGAERVFVTLANEFSRLIKAPVHLVLARDGDAYKDEVDAGVHIVELGQRSVKRALLPLVSYLRSARPQVLLSTMSDANVVALLARKLARVEMRTVIREANIYRPDQLGSNTAIKRSIIHMLMKRLYRDADAMVVIADDVLASLEAAGIGVAREHIFIGNPVRPETYADEPKLPARLGQGSFICAMGRLVKQKGFDILLDAYARLPETAPELVILGEGPLRMELQAQAERLGIADRLHMPGFVKAPGSVVRCARLFVSSSRWEGFPNAIMDALSAGTPVVATRCPGASCDILEKGRYGHLVATENPEALAAGMQLGLGSPAATPEQRIARSQQFLPTFIARRYLSEALLIRNDQLTASVSAEEEESA